MPHTDRILPSQADGRRVPIGLRKRHDGPLSPRAAHGEVALDRVATAYLAPRRQEGRVYFVELAESFEVLVHEGLGEGPTGRFDGRAIVVLP